MAQYIKKSDVMKAMENNSHMVEIFGIQKKMIDGFCLCIDIAEMETIEINDKEREIDTPHS